MAYRLYLDWLSLHQVITIRLTLSWPGPQLLDVQMAFSGAGMEPRVFRAACPSLSCKKRPTQQTKTSFLKSSNNDEAKHRLQLCNQLSLLWVLRFCLLVFSFTYAQFSVSCDAILELPWHLTTNFIPACFFQS